MCLVHLKRFQEGCKYINDYHQRIYYTILFNIKNYWCEEFPFVIITRLFFFIFIVFSIYFQKKKKTEERIGNYP